jgi:hypothetical protein
MSENFLSFFAVGCMVIIYFVKPNEPYFNIVINPNGNILNKINVTINESYTNKISEIITKISFWKTLDNTKSEEIKLSKEKYDQSMQYKRNSYQKNCQKQYLHKYINYKPLEYITEDGEYGQYIIIDA